MVSFAVVQIVLLLVICYYLFRFGQKGILWSNKQMQSRSRAYFLIIGCLIVPIYEGYMSYYVKQMNSFVKDIPELHSTMPTWLMHFVWGLAFSTAFMAL